MIKLDINKNSYKKIILVAGVALLLLFLLVSALPKNKSKNSETTTYIKNTAEEESKSEPQEEEIIEEGPSSYDIKQSVKFLMEHPWYTKQPIYTDKYSITWNLDENAFRIRLKIPESSPQEVKDNYTQEAIEALENLTGNLFKQYKYYILYEN